MGSDLARAMTLVMECVEFFAGCGGAALGLQSAGLRHALFVEADPFCALSLMTNFPGVPVCTQNLFLYKVEEILKERGIGRDFRGVIWLSPPCQGLSSGGLKLGEADVRNFLLFTASAAADYAPNAWVVVENVTGLQKGNAKPLYDELIRQLRATRDVATWELRSVEWGCAQDRNRLFIVAAPVGKRVPAQPRPPEGTVEKFVKDEFDVFVDHDPDFFPLAANELPIYEQIGDGENWQASELGRKYAKQLGFRGKKATFLRRIGSNKHWPCQQASPPRGYNYRADFVHWKERRHVTVGEAKAAMTLPPAHLLAGDIERRWRQNGNAVMPFMAELVARAIIGASGETPCRSSDGLPPSGDGTPGVSAPSGQPSSTPTPAPASVSHPVIKAPSACLTPAGIAIPSAALSIVSMAPAAALGKPTLDPEPITTYAEFDEMIRAFDEGLIGLLIVVGSHGLGKTERFLRFKNLAYVNNSASARGIYEWALNNIDKALVLDDLDGLLRVREVIALLKALCDTRDVKTVSLTKLLPAGVPSQFQTRSHVCLAFNELPDLDANVRALLDRGTTVVFAPDAQEVHRHVGEWFKNREVYELVGQHLGQITVPSMRIYLKIEELSKRRADWREWALRLLGGNGASQRAPEGGQTVSPKQVLEVGLPPSKTQAAPAPTMAPRVDAIAKGGALGAPMSALARPPAGGASSMGDGRVVKSVSCDQSEIIGSILSLYRDGRLAADGFDVGEECGAGELKEAGRA